MYDIVLPYPPWGDGARRRSWGNNAYIVDAIIGLSVVYEELANLGVYQRWFGLQRNTKAATLIFGFFHGTGLATKVPDYDIASDGLLANLLAFNVGVELGYLMALGVIVLIMGFWRKSPDFQASASVPLLANCSARKQLPLPAWLLVEGGRVNLYLQGHGAGRSETYEKARGSTGSEGAITASFAG